MDLEHFFVIAG